VNLDLNSLLASLTGSPVLVLGAVALMIFGPKLGPILGPILAAVPSLLAKLKPASPAPASPATPATPSAPADPVAIPSTGRPLIDLALKVFAAVAARKFPALGAAEALERYMVEQTHYGYYAIDSAAEKPAEAPAAPAVK
jgi:hypothetical protein